MNGNFNLQQQAAQQFQNQQNQQYAPYYFAQGQQSQPAVQAQPNQATQPQQSTQGTPQAAQTLIQPSGVQAESDPTYAYSRYHTTAAAYQAPPNYAMYQQAIPNQLSHPQPQQYSLGTSGQAAYAGAGVVAAAPSGATSNSNSTPVQDTLNATSSSMVGQYQPAGIRPRVTTTMWEDEKTLCYQVDANNVSVVRRADNNMINGTKLLNVAQMTRGRRDGILKSEKIRHVVKIGSMHLKGVWIPFERALAMAQREGIVDLLYPLFVRDIKRVIQTGVTPSSSGAASAAAQAAAQAAAVSQASAKSASTPTASNVTPTTGQPNLGLYQQYNQQYGSGQQYSQVNGAATASLGPGASGQHSPLQTEQHRQLQYQQVSQQQPQQQQVQQNLQSQTQQTQQSQQAQSGQVYGYQQPYYAGAAAQAGTAPNQYYQPYNSTPNYSATYGSQPMYSYGYNQQMPPQMPPQGTPQIAGGTAGSSIPSQVGSSDTQGTSMKEEKR